MVVSPRYRAATTKVIVSAISTLFSESAQKENPTIIRKIVTGSARRITIPTQVRSGQFRLG